MSLGLGEASRFWSRNSQEELENSIHVQLATLEVSLPPGSVQSTSIGQSQSH